LRLPRTTLAPIAIAWATLTTPLDAQQGRGLRPRIFFDCSGPSCNSQYYRTEINWVNWVNDPEVADLHVIMGSVGAGAGGREYQLDFLGVDADEDYQDQLTFSELSTDTQREALDGLTHTLGLGIAEWANSHGYRGLVRLEGTDADLADASRRLVSRDEVDDPWNLWVFRINARGERSSEETSTTTQLNGGFNVSRVTPTWKLSFNTFVNHRRLRRELTDSTFRDVRTDWSFNQLVAYSVARHWSVGFSGQIGKQTSNNRRLRADVSPALEYSFFTYEEATRHSLTALYTVGPSYQNYIEQTIYLKTEEVKWKESLEINFSSRQPWGDAGFTISGSNYLNDFGLNHRSIEGDVNYRITRGVSIFAQGSLEWVNDQIYLPAQDATDEETLLNLQSRATDQASRFSVGLQFQFGSIFNNVVNNRFRGVPGFGRGF
jgi:hypothetical protein